MSHPDPIVSSDKIYLHRLSPCDDLSEYLEWVNDEETTTYMDLRHKALSLDNLKTYIASHLLSNNYLCGIFTHSPYQHVGNVLLDSINSHNLCAKVGILIGKPYWGNGFGVEAIQLICDYGFTALGLHKIRAGIAKPNSGSVKLFERAGFIREGILMEEFKMGDHFEDILCYGKINPYKNEFSH